MRRCILIKYYVFRQKPPLIKVEGMTSNSSAVDGRKLGILGLVAIIALSLAFSGDVLAKKKEKKGGDGPPDSGTGAWIKAPFDIPGPLLKAGTVTVDGIKQSGEYERDPNETPTIGADETIQADANSGSKVIHWFNNHDEVYGFDEPDQMNPLFWEINEIADQNKSVSTLNLFFEVPVYARLMIWDSGCVFSAGKSVTGAGCGDLLGGSADDGEVQDILEAYDQGSHHKDVKMDYKTQTGSEFFQLNSDDEADPTRVFYTKWQNEDANGLDDGITWKMSCEYVLANDTDLCLAFDTTASIEMMMRFDSDVAARTYVNGVESTLLHLSDPAKGIPGVPKVPVPVAFWLFGTALIGFIGISRRTSLS